MKQTIIDRHYIGGHGPLLEFMDQSRTFQKWSWTENQSKSALRKVVQIEDKIERNLALSLVYQLDSARTQADELRKRLDTAFRAINKINASLQEQ